MLFKKTFSFIAALSLLAAAPLFAGDGVRPLSFRDTAAKIKPSVVNISTEKKVSSQFRFGGENPMFDEFFEKFFGEGKRHPEGPGERTYKQRSLGSGVIVDNKGYVLTNNHVVEDADKIKVKLFDQTEYDAKVVGRDKKTDLAVIKIIEGKNLVPAGFGDSKKMEVGDWVVAVGSPFGLEQTVSHGIISAKGRVIGAGPYDDFLQTDAPINPGNSGGPLVNLEGKIVGINTAITSRSGGNDGVGFAIPSVMAKRIYRQLVKDGQVTRGWLGVTIQALSPSLGEYFELPKDLKGIVVSDVMEEGPAAAAGMKSGDVIVKFGGKEVETVRELQRIVAETGVGNKVTVKVWREKKLKTIKVKIGNMGDFDEEEKGSLPEKVKTDIGLDVRAVEQGELEKYGLKKRRGAVVRRVVKGGPASEAGLKAGDLIVEVNKNLVTGPSKFGRILAELKPGKAYIFRIRRGGRSLFLSLDVPK